MSALGTRCTLSPQIIIRLHKHGQKKKKKGSYRVQPSTPANLPRSRASLHNAKWARYPNTAPPSKQYQQQLRLSRSRQRSKSANHSRQLFHLTQWMNACRLHRCSRSRSRRRTNEHTKEALHFEVNAVISCSPPFPFLSLSL